MYLPVSFIVGKSSKDISTVVGSQKSEVALR